MSNNYDVWPLSALMAGVSTERVIRVAERIAEAPLPRHERAELTGLLVSLSGVRLRRRLVLARVWSNPMLKDLLSESSVVAEWRDQGVRKSVRLVLQTRFGPISDELWEAIQQKEEDELDDLLVHSVTDSLEHIKARLGLS